MKREKACERFECRGCVSGSFYRIRSAAVSQGQSEFPRLPRVHAELEPQSLVPAARRTQRPEPGVTPRHSDRHQDGAASRRWGLQPGQRAAQRGRGGGVGGEGGGRGGRTRERLRSSGALRHSTVTVENFSFHRRFSVHNSSLCCCCYIINVVLTL